MTVNLEGFLLLNAAMNLLAFMCAARLAGLRLRMARGALVSAGGALYAVLAYLPGLEVLQGAPRLLVPVLMGAAAFAPARPAALARGCMWLCGCTFLLGGTGMGMMGIWGMRGYTLPPVLVTVCAGGAAAFWLFSAVKRARLRGGAVDVHIEAFGRHVRLKGMVDTGNCLAEPISGLPVIVVSGARLAVDREALRRRSRPVAFRSVGGDGLLEAFEPDSLKLDGKHVRNAYIALADGVIDGGYDALVPGELVALKGRALSHAQEALPLEHP